jgi:hypothetical protein
MNVLLECTIIGSLSVVLCLIIYKMISNKQKGIETSYFNIDDYIAYLQILEVRNKVILCFFIGALLHYIVKVYNLDKIYCEKVCYGSECKIVCKIKK